MKPKFQELFDDLRSSLSRDVRSSISKSSLSHTKLYIRNLNTTWFLVAIFSHSMFVHHCLSFIDLSLHPVNIMEESGLRTAIPNRQYGEWQQTWEAACHQLSTLPFLAERTLSLSEVFAPSVWFIEKACLDQASQVHAIFDQWWV